MALLQNNFSVLLYWELEEPKGPEALEGFQRRGVARLLGVGGVKAAGLASASTWEPRLQKTSPH